MPMNLNSYYIKRATQTGLLTSCILVASMSTAKTYPMLYHVVEANETLSGLSKKFGIDVDYIVELNDIEKGPLQQGQKILVPDIGKVKLTTIQNGSKNKVTSDNTEKLSTTKTTTTLTKVAQKPQVPTATNKVTSNWVSTSKKVGSIKVTQAVPTMKRAKIQPVSNVEKKPIPSNIAEKEAELAKKQEKEKLEKAKVETAAVEKATIKKPEAKKEKEAVKTETAKTTKKVEKTTAKKETKKAKKVVKKKINRKEFAKLNKNGNYDYLVQPGDTLSHIARDFGTTLAKLQEINNIDDSFLLKADDLIIVPNKNAKSSKKSSKSKSNSSKSTVKKDAAAKAVSAKGKNNEATDIFKYTIQAGDSLLALALKYGISQQGLAEINSIQNVDKVDVGQVIQIPGKDYVPKSVAVFESAGTY